MNVKKGKQGRFNYLIPRVRAVEEIVGYGILYHSPSGFNKKTVEKWLRMDAYPRIGSLREFCRCAGLTLAEFEAADNEFARALARVSSRLREEEKTPHAVDEERVLDVMNGFRKGGGLMSVLSETIDSIGKKAMEKYYHQFRGYYIGYLNWTRWVHEDGARAELKGATFRCLVKVEAQDPEVHVIRARLTTRNHMEQSGGRDESRWAYEGVMIPIPGKLIFIFEAPNPSFEEMDFVFMITQNTPKEHLMGIVSSDSSITDAASLLKVQPVPSASRILLKKAPDDMDEDALIEQLDYRREIEPEILELIRNEIHEDTGILMTHFLGPGS